VPSYFIIGLLPRENIYQGVRDEFQINSYGLSVERFSVRDENNTIEALLYNVVSVPDKCRHLRRPTKIRYRHTYWQVQHEGQEDIVVYSAFYDDRPIVGALPWIRILGVRRLSDKPVWCYVWYSQTQSPFVVPAEVIITGRIHNESVEGGKLYSQFLFSCQLSNPGFIPTHVSIATRLCGNSTIYLEIVHNWKSNNWTHNFGICVAVSFGYFSPELFVEWMEAYSMFGVTHVNIYNGSIDSRLDRVFDYYRKKGILEIRQIPPAVEDYSIKGIKLGAPASLNDCMMRNMYAHRFIVVVDFDEFIVPRIHNNYMDMIRYIDRSENRAFSHHTYSFRNVFFFKYFPQDETQPKILSTSRYQYRSQPSRYRYLTKSFVDPRRCKSVLNHYCHVLFPNSGSLGVDVNTSIAVSQHYRSNCSLGKAKCPYYNKEIVVDDFMLKYKDILLSRVSAVLNEIGIFSV